jgi:glucan biosynthesis protein C
MASQTQRATSQSPGAASAAAPGQAAATPQGTRLLFIDNLRTVLICVVVVAHVAMVYSRFIPWEYLDPSTDLLTSTLLSLVIGIANAWGMGLFFLIAGYFTPGSYDRKGGASFLRDRLVRLGIPLLLYGVLLDPLVVYIAGGLHGSYWSFSFDYLPHVGEWMGAGQVWFLEVLLFFSILYAAGRGVTRQRTHRDEKPGQLPGTPAIAGFILALGLLSFVWRLWWPGSSRPLNLPVGYFPQYISFYLLGLIAYRRNWFLALSPGMGKAWLRTALIVLLVPILLAILFIGVIGARGTQLDSLLGGFSWQAFVVALWEALMVVAASIGLLVLFRQRWNRQGRLAKRLAATAYTVYLIHPLLVVSFTYAIHTVGLYPLLKFAIAALVTLPLCFLVGFVILKIPLARRVL